MGSARGSGRRMYGEACAASHALDLVGERWALLVVRELLLGPKRFVDLRKGLPNVSPDVLSRRLRGLEEVGVVRRRRLPPPAASNVYELTDWGADLEPVIVSLGRWGARSPLRSNDAGMSKDSLILSFRTMFAPDSGPDMTLALRLGEDSFDVRISDGKLDVSRGEPKDSEVIIETDEETLIPLVYEDADLDSAVGSGRVAISGDRRSAERFLGLFPLPEIADTAG